MQTQIKSIQTNKLSKLVKAWCEHQQAPCKDSLDVLTTYLNEEILLHVPLDRFRGTILEGHEAIVKQDALIMLSGGFLVGNHQLMQATAIHDHDLIAEELMRSMSASIRFVRMRVRRKIVTEQRRTLTLIGEGVSTAPIIESHEQDLRTIERVLMRALREHRITILDHKLALAVIRDGENYKKVSRWLQISKSQGYRRLKKSVKILQQLIGEEHS